MPNLGVVHYKDGLSFVMADIPGIIEGAARARGSGHQFLRHVERCRVLVHLVDLSSPGEGRAPLRDLDVLDHELGRYSPELAKKPQIVAANKIDLPDARDRLPDFVAAMAARDVPVFPISAATGEGVGALLDAVAQVLSGGALPMLGRSERPRRRPKTGVRGDAAVEPSSPTAILASSAPAAPARGRKTRGARAGTGSLNGPGPKNGRRPGKKSTGRTAASRSPATPRGASTSRGGARKGSARSPRRPGSKGTR